jgi:glucokinase
VEAVGVSAPGPLDPVASVIRDAPNLPGWHEVPIRARLERALGRPVRLENDANAAALAEFRFGAGRGARAFVFLTMSTGVGAGLVLDGRLYRGARYGAGRGRSHPVVPDGRRCACGLHGCLEATQGPASPRILRTSARREDAIRELVAEPRAGQRASGSRRCAQAIPRRACAVARPARAGHRDPGTRANTDCIALGVVARNSICFSSSRRRAIHAPACCASWR